MRSLRPLRNHQHITTSQSFSTHSITSIPRQPSSMPLLWFIAYFYDKRRARRETRALEQARQRQAQQQGAVERLETFAQQDQPRPTNPTSKPAIVPRASWSGGYTQLEDAKK